MTVGIVPVGSGEPQLTELRRKTGLGRQELARGAVTARILGRHGLRLLVERAPDQTVSARAAAELREAFTELGPTYVKLAQLVASSPGLFPQVLAEELRGLLDNAPPVPLTQVRSVLLAELGAQPEELFASFDPEPLAAASIAQVHAATLPDGRDVVVKIQRPDIRDRIDADLQLLTQAARLLSRTSLARFADTPGMVDDAAATLLGELNFMREARSMEHFGRLLSADAASCGVRVPAVEWPLTTARVLTMERIRGTVVDDLRLADTHDVVELLRRGVGAWLRELLRSGFFHADVHAGNLMVDVDGDVVFLDFGAVGQLSSAARAGLRDTLPALLFRSDYDSAARLLGELTGDTALPFEAIAADLASTIAPQLAEPCPSYGQLLISVLRVGARHGAAAPRDLVLVGKQLLYFERYVRLLAPDWSLLTDPLLADVLLPSDPQTPAAVPAVGPAPLTQESP
ncbi:MAG: AarF/UbiB family protein [Mycobacteriales bacterium]|nr:AarF/UbiB family protein [Mycobacteriales bacterium]